MEEEREFDNSRNILETQPNTSRISVSNAGRESIVHEAFHEALSDYGCKSKSYDLSPYKESDDENVDADSVISNSKFIPSLSSQHSCCFPVSLGTATLAGTGFSSTFNLILLKDDK
ncbi:hypothetical protein DVH24_041926 [Malus domestica]|uniref:Uncharacterized protein n=1 Tax=Malus domestica TaxID=3750 RepID=A0A498INP6_MALDO|nr:hypothetical protein DVH24_041926 [Malus domestica]